MDNKICPITGNTCTNCKAYHVVDVEKNKSTKHFNVCCDCLPNINTKFELYIPQDCCDFCGTTIEELLKHSKMGCSNCYDKYEKPLILNLEKLQKIPNKGKKELKHVGSIPYLWKMQQAENTDPNKFLLELKQKLMICIKEEKYEKAKDLKDKIKAFEFYLKKVDEFKNDEEQCALINKQIAEFIYLFRESELEEN
jgi:protein-arginine kinase activator protein McsA